MCVSVWIIFWITTLWAAVFAGQRLDNFWAQHAFIINNALYKQQQQQQQ